MYHNKFDHLWSESSVVYANKYEYFYTHFCHDDELKNLSITQNKHTTVSNHTAINYNSHGTKYEIVLHISTHNFYYPAAPLHVLQGPKHL